MVNEVVELLLLEGQTSVELPYGMVRRQILPDAEVICARDGQVPQVPRVHVDAVDVDLDVLASHDLLRLPTPVRYGVVWRAREGDE